MSNTASFGTPISGKLPVGVAIIAQPEDTGPDATGSYVLGRNVVFRFPTGDTATQFFPYAGLTTEAIITAGEQAYNTVTAIYALSNP